MLIQESLFICKHNGFDEVEKCPEFLGVVLEGSPSHEGGSFAGELSKISRKNSLCVLHLVSLVDHYMLEGYFFENVEVFDEAFIVHQQDVELWYATFDYFAISTSIGVVKFKLLANASPFTFLLIVVN